MRKSTKFGVVTGAMAGIALASGSLVMWPLWTALSIGGVYLLRKKDIESFDMSKISQQSLEHMRKVMRSE